MAVALEESRGFLKRAKGGTVRFTADATVIEHDGALRGAMRFLLDRMKLVVEPSGAITVAALMQGLVRADGGAPEGDTVAVLSGGNIEWDGLRALLGDG